LCASIQIGRADCRVSSEARRRLADFWDVPREKRIVLKTIRPVDVHEYCSAAKIAGAKQKTRTRDFLALNEGPDRAISRSFYLDGSDQWPAPKAHDDGGVDNGTAPSELMQRVTTGMR